MINTHNLLFILVLLTCDIKYNIQHEVMLETQKQNNSDYGLIDRQKATSAVFT